MTSLCFCFHFNIFFQYNFDKLGLSSKYIDQYSSFRSLSSFSNFDPFPLGPLSVHLLLLLHAVLLPVLDGVLEDCDGALDGVVEDVLDLKLILVVGVPLG